MSIRSRHATLDDDDDDTLAMWSEGGLLDPVPEEAEDDPVVVNPKQVKRLARRFLAWRSRRGEPHLQR